MHFFARLSNKRHLPLRQPIGRLRFSIKKLRALALGSNAFPYNDAVHPRTTATPKAQSCAFAISEAEMGN